MGRGDVPLEDVSVSIPSSETIETEDLGVFTEDDLETRVSALEAHKEELLAYLAEYREQVTPLDLLKHELLRIAARWPWVRRLREALEEA